MSHKGPNAFTCISSTTSITIIRYVVTDLVPASDIGLVSCLLSHAYGNTDTHISGIFPIVKSVADLEHCQVLSMPLWHIALDSSGAKSSIADQSIWGARKLLHQLLNAIPFALVTKESLQVAMHHACSVYLCLDTSNTTMAC